MSNLEVPRRKKRNPILLLFDVIFGLVRGVIFSIIFVAFLTIAASLEAARRIANLTYEDLYTPLAVVGGIALIGGIGIWVLLKILKLILLVIKKIFSWLRNSLKGRGNGNNDQNQLSERFE